MLVSLFRFFYLFVLVITVREDLRVDVFSSFLGFLDRSLNFGQLCFCLVIIGVYLEDLLKTTLSYQIATLAASKF